MPLRLAFWETTAACNLACAHCRRDELSAHGDLTTAEGEAFIDQLPALGAPLLVLSGGEPLMRPDWERLARHAVARGLPVAMASNGTRIDGATAERIRGAGIRRVAVSVDGADAGTHEGLRRQSGCFAAARAGVAALRAAGVPVQLNCTITRRNHRQLAALLALARAWDCCALHLFVLVPVGCGMGIADADMLDPEETEEVLIWIARHARDAGIELRPTCAPQYRRVAATVAAADGLPDSAAREGGCLAGRSIVFISHRGEVRPCGYLPLAAGDLRQQALAEIWRASALLADLGGREDLGGGCATCAWSARCGGCRARALGVTGSLRAAEPTCPVAQLSAG